MPTIIIDITRETFAQTLETLQNFVSSAGEDAQKFTAGLDIVEAQKPAVFNLVYASLLRDAIIKLNAAVEKMEAQSSTSGQMTHMVENSDGSYRAEYHKPREGNAQPNPNLN